MIILKQLNGKAIWLLDTLNQDSIEKKLARMYSTAYVNFVLCRLDSILDKSLHARGVLTSY